MKIYYCRKFIIIIIIIIKCYSYCKVGRIAKSV